MNFVRLFRDQDMNQDDRLFNDFVEGLSLPKKRIPFWTTYFGDGYDYWKKICHSEEYYGKHKQLEMVIEQKNNILDLFSQGGEKFNLIDMGAGDGDKTFKLLEGVVQNKVKTEYMPIDFQHDTILALGEKMKKFQQTIPMTFLTCKFQQGIQWIQKQRSEKNVYMFLAGTFGTLEPHEKDQLMTCFSKYLKKGDVIAFSFMQAIDPFVVQKTFFNEKRYWIDWMMESMKRANAELGANFNIDKFWPHTYYEPASKNAYGVIVSRENQSVQFRGKEFQFSAGEVIEVMTAHRFTEEAAFEAMNIKGGYHKIGKFEDKDGYTMLLCLQKE